MIQVVINIDSGQLVSQTQRPKGNRRGIHPIKNDLASSGRVAHCGSKTDIGCIGMRDDNLAGFIRPTAGITALRRPGPAG